MALLPFYLPGRTAPKIIILGGGYAGISAAVSFRRYCPECEVTLIDSRDSHLKLTHLHESFRPFPPVMRVPFSTLAERFDFRFIRATLQTDRSNLLKWEADRVIHLSDEMLSFDYLLVATGSRSPGRAPSERVFSLDDFIDSEPSALLERMAVLGDGALPISVVGSGATGIQFLCEIAEWMGRRGLANPLRLIDRSAVPLRQFPPSMGNYIRAKLAELGVEYQPNKAFIEQGEQELLMGGPNVGDCERVPSALTMVFAGKAPEQRLETDPFGQVVVGERTLRRIFAAGDCSNYRGFGSNAMTAQAAVRKAKLCARNILRSAGLLPCREPYLHRELGYVVGLGSRDSVGWVGVRSNLVGGGPAVALKELVESQHELMLAGIDTYLV